MKGSYELTDVSKMTKTTLINKLLALPAKKRRYLVRRINDSLREEKGEKRSTNPDNPSPSGDPWWDDPENVKIVDAGLADVRAGRVVRLDEDSELQAIFAKYVSLPRSASFGGEVMRVVSGDTRSGDGIRQK
ncbi:hypothetical protein FACS189443_6600 [Planctomycetales bacterium]|nr:hypothetical protein FACS189443_6600 [Planctomycetales bacterium]